VDHVVLGFGINIRRAAYPPDVVARATSLESELGRDVDRGLVLAECLAALSNRVLELTPEGVHQYGGGYTEYVARTGQEAPGLHPGG